MGKTENSTERDNIKWHPAFVEALQAELIQYKDVLSFESEHNLTSAPLRIDVLIIKKEKDIEIKKKIATSFKAHNIIEYKSPDDYLSINDFYKVYAYLYLYKSFENVDITDLTLTFSIICYPREVFKHLQDILKLTIIKKTTEFIRAVGFNTPPLRGVTEGIKPAVQFSGRTKIRRRSAAGIFIMWKVILFRFNLLSTRN
ncbi:MAG: hypothetical protein Ta2F_13340 [Termitinemataceae bacterium]|nr:MAG: hypothetical protein Ta2F_13340 [Termitinemataceae bacterium]